MNLHCANSTINVDWMKYINNYPWIPEITSICKLELAVWLYAKIVFILYSIFKILRTIILIRIIHQNLPLLVVAAQIIIQHYAFFLLTRFVDTYDYNYFYRSVSPLLFLTFQILHSGFVVTDEWTDKFLYNYLSFVVSLLS